MINNEYYLSGYGKEIDWWSLGVVFYEMIFNREPFGSQERVEIFFGNFEKFLKTRKKSQENGLSRLYDRILYEDPDFRYAPRRTRLEAKDLIRVLLDKEPTDRLGHMGADEVKGKKRLLRG